VNPADPKEVVGQVRAAGIDQAETAIETAARFFSKWRATPAAERAKLLAKAGAIMRKKRWELAAWEVFEVGKGWREADGDVTEAIDYLEYYAREMLRLSAPRQTNSCRVKPTFIFTSRAVSRRSSRRGIFRWRSLPA